jgi:tetratricopeptide (TPR) repeat protein
MNLTEFREKCLLVAKLVKSKEYAKALEILISLINSPLPDLDKSMMLINMATICKEIGRSKEALDSYNRAIELERPYKRYFASCCKASYLAETGRIRDSLNLFREIISYKELDLANQEMILTNIRLLETKQEGEKIKIHRMD